MNLLWLEEKQKKSQQKETFDLGIWLNETINWTVKTVVLIEKVTATEREHFSDNFNRECWTTVYDIIVTATAYKGERSRIKTPVVLTTSNIDKAAHHEMLLKLIPGSVLLVKGYIGLETISSAPLEIKNIEVRDLEPEIETLVRKYIFTKV